MVSALWRSGSALKPIPSSPWSIMRRALPFEQEREPPMRS